MTDPLPFALGRDEVTGLGSAMAGGKGRLAKTARTPLDYYPTPADATIALVHAEHVAMRRHGRHVWEPCGRGGAIADVLTAASFSVTASDIVPDPAHDVAELDLLATTQALAPIVCTNPPFALAGRMIEHLLGRLRLPYVALLLKTTFWCTDSEDRGRLGLWRRHPPQRRWDMSWRVDFTGGGQSTMNVSWFVWDRNHAGPRTWDVLTRDGPASVPYVDLLGRVR